MIKYSLVLHMVILQNHQPTSVLQLPLSQEFQVHIVCCHIGLAILFFWIQLT